MAADHDSSIFPMIRSKEMDKRCLIRGSVARNWHGTLGIVQRRKPYVSKDVIKD